MGQPGFTPGMENKMKLLIALLAAAGLAGCVAYPAPYGSAGVYYNDSPSYGGYYGGYYGAPYVIDQGPIIIQGRGGYARGMRDRDHDGIPNRYDRDRDGDGVPNRRDAFPNDPRRR